MNSAENQQWVRQAFSLRLPSVSIYFDPQTLQLSELASVGEIRRTDLDLCWTPQGQPYFQVFIHYWTWYNTEAAYNLQTQIKHGRVVLPMGIGTVVENTSNERFFQSSLEHQAFHTQETDQEFERWTNDNIERNIEQTCAELFIENIQQQQEMWAELMHQNKIGLWTPPPPLHDAFLGHTQVYTHNNNNEKWDPFQLEHQDQGPMHMHEL